MWLHDYMQPEGCMSSAVVMRSCGCNGQPAGGHMRAMRRRDDDDEPAGAAEARFADLYRDHARDVLAYAVRRAASAEDAADVVAETFLVAWRRDADVPRGAGARLWLYGVARRTLANQLRGERRRSRLAARMRAELPAVLAAAVAAPT